MDNERVLIKDLHEHIGKEVGIAGSIDVRRDHGKLVFLDIRDRSGTVQCVATPKQESAHKAAEELRGEWVVRVKGNVNERPEKMKNSEQANGDIEVELTEIEVLSRAAELPFEKDGEAINIDTYLDNLPFTLRTSKNCAMLRIQAHIIQAFRTFLIENEFTEIQVPKITGNDAEGGAAVFEVGYFNHTAYLATSPQLYKQIMVGVLERVFTTTSVYRAEKHATTRHLNEYTSLDLEFGFIESHEDIMDLKQELVRFILDSIKENCAEELALWGAELPKVPEQGSGGIPRMKLREAQEILKKEYSIDCVGEPDLEPEHERKISEYVLEKYKSDFLFVTHYPVEKRPFYTFEDEEDRGYTKSFDLLFRGLEISTGGQRIHDYEQLVANMKKWDLDPEKFSFYLQAFKYGMPPEGGLATGLERFTARLLGLESVKRATLFPRDMNRIDLPLGKSE